MTKTNLRQKFDIAACWHFRAKCGYWNGYRHSQGLINLEVNSMTVMELVDLKCGWLLLASSWSRRTEADRPQK